MIKLTIKLLKSLFIAILSLIAADVFPEHAWGCGWMGACLYYILIVSPGGADDYKRGWKDCAEKFKEEFKRRGFNVGGGT